ncbi:transposable element Tc1 transposase [Trichonephila clavipes]|nr:transposable element Tc1 transposase [Trichonephila clavipes]
MARRNHLDDFTRGRMIGQLEEGRTVTSVAAEFRINKSVVSRAWKAFQTTGEKRPTAVSKRHCSATFYSKGRQVSRFTAARRLHKGGLFARRPEHCLPLKVDHRRHHLQWCREHKNGTTDQWSRVLFTDESRFSTRSDSQRVLIWREIGTRFYTSNIKERHHYGGPGVLVWGGTMLNGRTELHIFDRGSVIGDRYCEEVLLPHVRLFRGAIGPDFIFMDGNTRPHRTLAVEELLESEDITRMDWPAYSPDLNPIKHVWDALGRRIAALLHHPENTQQLKQMLIEEWVLLPQEMLHQLVLNMRRRCEATIANGTEEFSEGVNLIGVIPGAQRGHLADEIVLVGAHYDTVADSNGVDDNGSGLAVMLEVARAITEAHCRLNHTLMFVAFDHEENGAMGSNYFVDHYLIPDELKRARARFQGAFILDGIMNYNDIPNTQELPLDYTESLPGFQYFVNNTGNRGNF